MGAGHRTAAPGRASRCASSVRQAPAVTESRRRPGPHTKPRFKRLRRGALALGSSGRARDGRPGLGMPELPVCRCPDRRSTRPGPGGEGRSSGGALHFHPLALARQRGARDDGRREAQAGGGARGTQARALCHSRAIEARVMHGSGQVRSMIELRYRGRARAIRSSGRWGRSVRGWWPGAGQGRRSDLHGSLQASGRRFETCRAHHQKPPFPSEGNGVPCHRRAISPRVRAFPCGLAIFRPVNLPRFRRRCGTIARRGVTVLRFCPAALRRSLSPSQRPDGAGLRR